jgi:[ribosomal protein S5]-alanine N-acetyltransferase
MTRAPERLETDRLALRRPVEGDAGVIFSRYAADPDVTRYLGWPRHRSIADTRDFLAVSDAEWARWPAGPYLIWSRADGSLLGGTGFAFETPSRAMTGYVLAKDAWGRGYATEALGAMVRVASSLGIRRLYALCHTDHPLSAHVLEKCGFEREGILRCHTEFPNLAPGEPADALCYALILK